MKKLTTLLLTAMFAAAPLAAHAQGTESHAHDRHARDRIVFGGDVVVPAGETVHDVVAFGGDVVVAGHVTGDAVTFGSWSAPGLAPWDGAGISLSLLLRFGIPFQAKNLINFMIPDNIDIAVVAGLGHELITHNLFTAELVSPVNNRNAGS